MLKEEIYDKIKSISLKELEILVVRILNKNYSNYKGDKKEETIKNITDGFHDNDNFLDFIDLLTSLKDISVNKAKDFNKYYIEGPEWFKSLFQISTDYGYKYFLNNYVTFLNKTKNPKNYPRYHCLPFSLSAF